jgi:hypothetical protein
MELWSLGHEASLASFEQQHSTTISQISPMKTPGCDESSG